MRNALGGFILNANSDQLGMFLKFYFFFYLFIFLIFLPARHVLHAHPAGPKIALCFLDLFVGLFVHPHLSCAQ